MHPRQAPRLGLAFILALSHATATRANVVGGDMQNFNPAPGGIDFVTVHSSETLEPGIMNVSLMLNHAVNSLPYFEDAGQSRLRYNDSLTMLDLGAGFGVGDNFEAGFALQDLLHQKIDDDASRGEFGSTGVINARIYGKLRLWGGADGGVAMVGTAVFNRIRNNPYVGDGGSPIGIVEFAGDTSLQKIAIAINLGYRFRKPGDPLPGFNLQPMGNQYIGSLGLSYLLPMVDTKLIVELFGARPASRTTTGLSARQASSAEILAGVKFDATTSLAFHAGGGTELIHGVSAPDWRAYAGLNWAFDVARPRPPAAPVIEHVAPKEERAILRNIKFAFGSDKVPDSALPDLRELARAIQATPYQRVIVEGHTDSVGSAEFNLKLSQRRAETVMHWLIAHANVPASKISAVGYGESRPVADNGNFQGREQNRRVEVRILR